MIKMISMFSVFTLLLAPNIGMASSKNAWTQCGLGAMIFSNTGWAAASSNIIWDWGITGMTSSSSSPSQCSGTGASVGTLIYENYANLEEEAAIGQGEHLNAMMNLLKCDSSVQNELIQDLRTDFLKDVKDNSYSKKSNLEKTEALYNNVMDKAGKKYSKFCSIG